MTDRLGDAVLNNARWCEAVCRAHGVPTSWRSNWWLAHRRSPPFYPDAITLQPVADFAPIAQLIEPGRGSSVKDSWARLELRPAGFSLLFEASWITLEPPAAQSPHADGSRWTIVGSAGELADWTTAHGTPSTFAPALLADPAIRFLAVRDGHRTVAGAIANLSGPVVGVSNVFGEDPWLGLPAAIAASFPRRPLVGYEQAAGLELPLSLGFRVLGPLRVWHRPTAAGSSCRSDS